MKCFYITERNVNKFTMSETMPLKLKWKDTRYRNLVHVYTVATVKLYLYAELDGGYLKCSTRHRSVLFQQNRERHMHCL